MSQWNNSYAYNNQYQGPNNWNGDPNGQYVNQGFYRPENNAQYVSFNEFLTQMQSGTASANPQNYNSGQYNNYSSNNQYGYQMPSTSQGMNDYSYSQGPSNAPSEVNSYPVNAQSQHNAQDHNELIFKSNLTPTATEFVPKNAVPQPSTSNQSIPEAAASSSASNSNASRNYGSSSDKNWRERPKSSHKNNETKENQQTISNGYSNDNQRNYSNPRNKDYRNNDSSNRNSDRNESNNRQNEFKSRHNHSSRKNDNLTNETDYSEEPRQESNQESNVRNYVQDSTRNHGQDSARNHGQDTARNYSQDSTRNYSQDSSRNYSQDSSRNNSQDSSRNYNQESSRNYSQESSRNYSQDSARSYSQDSTRNDRKNHKGKAKKESDNRTFYNSTINKDQDVRGREGGPSGRRTFAGSQRLRGNDRFNQENEQYANNYLQQKEERNEDRNKEKVSKSYTPSPVKFKSKGDQIKEVNKEMTQRERLTEQLDKGTLECLVCCDRVKQADPVWWCSNCYHVLHLRCIRKWAVSSSVEGKWRCPACQNTNESIPTEYRCMCGAIRSPDYQRGSTGAHTCGRSCRRPRLCPHPCTLLCHPGPCPPCQATVTKKCGCGAETRSVLCSSKLSQVCGRVCNKTLSCGEHKCGRDCHEGPCEECDKVVTQVCSCPARGERSVLCGSGGGATWSCGAACGRVLACGAHVCRAPCHEPPCEPCKLLPAAVLTCPCGKMKLDKEQRKLCTDPIPLCGSICAKPLACGPDGDKHFCKQDCHEGQCPVCPEKTLLQCRCGHSSREVPCADLPEMMANVLCQKKCNKKLSCGRHRCRTTCCAATSHRCTVVCGRSLTCGLHRCEEFCHTGHCAPCPRLGFEEIRCACGESTLFPPVPCGARPPPCSAPCRLPRACQHPPHHSCHQGDCPPCVVLTAKRCHGLHEERKTIPCSQEDFSCGLPCGKPLPCGKHTCIKICHKGPCDTSKCSQPCQEKRPRCGHECAAPCHSDGSTTCPSSSPCKKLVRAVCPCGRRQAERTCSDNSRDYARIMSTLAATKMQEGGSVDLSDVQRPGNVLKTLECDDTCRQEARSRQLALALQIRNPDVSAKLAPRYSDMVRQTAARDPSFASHVHDKLTDLVQLAKKSKQKTRAHSFPSMNRQKRQFIHELCEHFGCESVAYDAEPNRNVVATADREKSWLPAMSVLEVLAREAGKRRVPGPVLRATPSTQSQPQSTSVPNSQPQTSRSTGAWATLTSSNAWAARAQPKPQPQQLPQQQPQQPEKIDYFDNPPDN